MSASTTTVSPEMRFTGNLPQSISGRNPSTTTRTRPSGGSIALRRANQRPKTNFLRNEHLPLRLNQARTLSPFEGWACAIPLRIPLSTYRLQLRPEFDFEATAQIADYLRDLGISH